jgi:hypothetical protein
MQFPADANAGFAQLQEVIQSKSAAEAALEREQSYSNLHDSTNFSSVGSSVMGVAASWASLFCRTTSLFCTVEHVRLALTHDHGLIDHDLLDVPHGR